MSEQVQPLIDFAPDLVADGIDEQGNLINPRIRSVSMVLPETGMVALDGEVAIHIRHPETAVDAGAPETGLARDAT